MTKQNDEEINLKDYLKVLNKWKFIIIAGTLIPAICTPIIYSSLATAPLPAPTYRGSAFLEIGSVMSEMTTFLLEDIKTLKTKIDLGAYYAALRKNSSIDNAPLPSITASLTAGTNIIQIITRSPNKALSKTTLEEISRLIIKDHTALAARMISRGTPVTPSRKFRLIRKTALLTKPSVKMIEPPLPQKRWLPSPLIVGVLGLMLSITLVFCVEYVREVRKH